MNCICETRQYEKRNRLSLMRMKKMKMRIQVKLMTIC